MNRVIKVRVWDKVNKKMLDNGKSVSVADLLTEYGLNYTHIGPEDIELLEYTGLKDKNGVEIFESDVLSSPHFVDAAGRKHTLNHLVEWSDKLHGWFLLSCQSKNPEDGSIQLFVAQNSEMSVIGNLHQNPDLIK